MSSDQFLGFTVAPSADHMLILATFLVEHLLLDPSEQGLTQSTPVALAKVYREQFITF